MRFPPIADDAMTPEQRAVAEAIRSGPRGHFRGPFVPLLHSPQLASHVQALGAHIRFSTSLPDDLLELAVIIVARHMDCVHIWASHSRHALKAGISRTVIADIAARREPQNMSADQQLIAEAVGDLLQRHKVSDGLFERAVARLGRNGAVELSAACGYYMMLAMVLNMAGPSHHPAADAFPVPSQTDVA